MIRAKAGSAMVRRVVKTETLERRSLDEEVRYINNPPDTVWLAE